MLDEDVRDIIQQAKLAFVATTNPDGSPNVSPKGSLRVYDDSHVAFMDIASPNTVENLRRDPRLEICIIDLFRRRGYRIKGKAELLPPGAEEYRWLNDWLLEINGAGYPANEIAMVTVQVVVPVRSPAYTWGGATEEALDAGWRDRYSASEVEADDCSGGRSHEPGC